MRIIEIQQDVKVLHRAGVLPLPMLEYVESYFRQLEVALQGDEEETFCLNRYGYIVVLEAGDNVRDLGNVGLNREDGGLLGRLNFFHIFKVINSYLSQKTSWSP